MSKRYARFIIVMVVYGFILSLMILALARADEIELSPTPPWQIEYEQRMRDADLRYARELCFAHSNPNGHLLGCIPYDRMCNRDYEWPECADVDKAWVETGAAKRDEARRQDEEKANRDFVLRQSSTR